MQGGFGMFDLLDCLICLMGIAGRLATLPFVSQLDGGRSKCGRSGSGSSQDQTNSENRSREKEAEAKAVIGECAEAEAAWTGRHHEPTLGPLTHFAALAWSWPSTLLFVSAFHQESTFRVGYACHSCHCLPVSESPVSSAVRLLIFCMILHVWLLKILSMRHSQQSFLTLLKAIFGLEGPPLCPDLQGLQLGCKMLQITMPGSQDASWRTSTNKTSA